MGRALTWQPQGLLPTSQSPLSAGATRRCGPCSAAPCGQTSLVINWNKRWLSYIIFEEEEFSWDRVRFAATPCQPRWKLLSPASHPFSPPSTFPGPFPRVSALGIYTEAPIKGADIFSYINGEPSLPIPWVYFSWITEKMYIYDFFFLEYPCVEK